METITHEEILIRSETNDLNWKGLMLLAFSVILLLKL